MIPPLDSNRPEIPTPSQTTVTRIAKDLDHLMRMEFRPIHKSYLDMLRGSIAAASRSSSPAAAVADEFGLFVISVTEIRETMRPKIQAVVEGWVKDDPGDWSGYVERVTEERIKTFQDDLTAAGLAVLKASGSYSSL